MKARQAAGRCQAGSRQAGGRQAAGRQAAGDRRQAENKSVFSIENECSDFDPLWVNILRLFSNLFLTINSSINFFVYYYSNEVEDEIHNNFFTF
jgi:hypothetical protein